MTDDTGNGRRPLAVAVGSGGALTGTVLRDYEITHGQPLVRCMAGAVAAWMPTFLAPPAAGAVLVLKGPVDERPTALWVHEHAMEPYFAVSAGGTPWKDQVLLIKQLLQLTVGDLARLLAVERPSVYHWLSGSQPRPAKQRRLDAVERFAHSWQARGLGPLRAYFTRTVCESNTTLDRLLAEEELNMVELDAHLNALAGSMPEAGRSRASVSDRLAARGFKPTSERTDRRQRARFVRQTSSGEE